MANHTQVGSVVVDAFQWLGGILSTSSVTLPVWAKQLALHTPGDGSLHIPTGGRHGTIRIESGEWALRVSTGHIEGMSNTTFTTLYT